MKKFVLVFSLLILIALTFGFVFLKSQALGAEENYFNRHWRATFSRQPLLRFLLGLHYDGDGRADYLGQRYKSILVEVDTMDGVEPRFAALELFVKRIQEATGKPATYLLSDRHIAGQSEIAESELEKIVNRYRNYHSAGDVATLYFLYAKQMAGEPDLLGKTYQEYGIVLFADSLRRFTADHPETLSNYEASTALHEFGHQLGLSHDEFAGCLMNTRAETDPRPLVRPSEVITDFCEQEKYELSQDYGR